MVLGRWAYFQGKLALSFMEGKSMSITLLVSLMGIQPLLLLGWWRNISPMEIMGGKPGNPPKKGTQKWYGNPLKMAESWPRSGKNRSYWCVYIWLKGYLRPISAVAFLVYCCWMVLWKMGLFLPWRITPWSCEWKTSRGIWNEWKPFRPPRCSVYHWRMSICRFFGESEKRVKRFSKLSGEIPVFWRMIYVFLPSNHAKRRSNKMVSASGYGGNESWVPMGTYGYRYGI